MSSIEIDALKKVRLDEGDVLLVTVPEDMLMVEIHRVRDVLQEAFPDNRVVCFMDDCEITVVRP